MLETRRIVRTILLVVAALMFILAAVFDNYTSSQLDVLGIGFALVVLALLLDTIVGITFEARRDK